MIGPSTSVIPSPNRNIALVLRVLAVFESLLVELNLPNFLMLKMQCHL